MFEIVSAAAPVFVTVSVCVVLDAVRPTLPRLSDVAESERIGVVGLEPVPE